MDNILTFFSVNKTNYYVFKQFEFEAGFHYKRSRVRAFNEVHYDRSPKRFTIVLLENFDHYIIYYLLISIIK